MGVLGVSAISARHKSPLERSFATLRTGPPSPLRTSSSTRPRLSFALNRKLRQQWKIKFQLPMVNALKNVAIHKLNKYYSAFRFQLLVCIFVSRAV